MEGHAQVLVLLIVLIVLGMVKADSSFSDLNFIPWGKPCRIPARGELQLPQDVCDESKGIFCQRYEQGQYCGCTIESHWLSYDKKSGECRRMPFQHCTFVNTTENPNILKELPRHVKCHEDAECIAAEPVSPNSENKKSKRANSKKKEVHFCKCKAGFIISRDHLECLSVNLGAAVTPPGNLFLMFLMTFSLHYYYSHC